MAARNHPPTQRHRLLLYCLSRLWGLTGPRLRPAGLAWGSSVSPVRRCPGSPHSSGIPKVLQEGEAEASRVSKSLRLL